MFMYKTDIKNRTEIRDWSTYLNFFVFRDHGPQFDLQSGLFDFDCGEASVLRSLYLF